MKGKHLFCKRRLDYILFSCELFCLEKNMGYYTNPFMVAKVLEGTVFDIKYHLLLEHLHPWPGCRFGSERDHRWKDHQVRTRCCRRSDDQRKSNFLDRVKPSYRDTWDINLFALLTRLSATAVLLPSASTNVCRTSYFPCGSAIKLEHQDCYVFNFTFQEEKENCLLTGVNSAYSYLARSN